MKLIRRIIAGLAIVGIAISGLLLLNITAPNPTGRRYSSEMPLIAGLPLAVGSDAERILSNDLHLPNNNDQSQRQCFCPVQPLQVPTGCNVCLAQLTFSGNSLTSRRPDFVAPTFIVKSKNVQTLLTSQSDLVSQINDYAQGAKATGRKLWVFTRVDTQIDPQYAPVVEGTGGAIIRYFVTPGFVDQTDEVARSGLGVSIVVLGCIGAVEIITMRRLSRRGREQTPIMTPAQPSGSKNDAANATAVRRAEQIVNHAGSFAKDAKARTQGKIDKLE